MNVCINPSFRMKKLSLLVMGCILLWLLLLQIKLAECAEFRRELALLDLAPHNNDSDSSTFGLEQALDIAGIPYSKTTDVGKAAKCSMVVTSSYLGPRTLTPAERLKLGDYVRNGGILVASVVTDSRLFALFGISESNSKRTRKSLTWQVEGLQPELHYFDDLRERTISLGSSSFDSIFPTSGYGLTESTSLAVFDDGSHAVTRNGYGSGKVYALGFSYKDLILRNELNLDYDAQRCDGINNFEPTSDTIMLLLRAIYESNVPFAVWKHTSPSFTRACLIITHDVSAQTTMDMMNVFADYEHSLKISTTYNITTHYIYDNLSNDYYTPNISKMLSLVEKGQKVGSHTVGHFPDWWNEKVFPMGKRGSTRINYQPYYKMDQTHGGNVYGELEVSRLLLEADLGIKVLSFRSGYLMWHPNQANILDALGYSYDSSTSTCDVLTNFPYLLKYDQSFNGQVSNVYEIPNTIDDTPGMDMLNFETKVAHWLDVISKNAANFAPTVLLIHPNRDFKLLAEQSLLEKLPHDIHILDLGSFGRFWRHRKQCEFRTNLTSDNRLIITILNKIPFRFDELVSLYLKDGERLAGIEIRRRGGASVQFERAKGEGQDLFLYGFKS